jgi:hypothetical protein
MQTDVLSETYRLAHFTPQGVQGMKSPVRNTFLFVCPLTNVKRSHLPLWLLAGLSISFVNDVASYVLLIHLSLPLGYLSCTRWLHNKPLHEQPELQQHRQLQLHCRPRCPPRSGPGHPHPLLQHSRERWSQAAAANQHPHHSAVRQPAEQCPAAQHPQPQRGHHPGHCIPAGRRRAVPICYLLQQ